MKALDFISGICAGNATALLLLHPPECRELGILYLLLAVIVATIRYAIKKSTKQ